MRKLYIQQKVFKLSDHYPVTDEQGNAIYQVDKDFELVGDIIDVSIPQGRHLFTIERQLMTLLPRYTITFADGHTLELRARFALFHRSIDIDPDGLGLHIHGNFLGLNFEVTRHGKPIGRLERPFMSWGDRYTITIEDEQYEQLMVAIVLAVDCITDRQEN